MMQARLISYTQPTEAMLALGLTDVKELVAFCARVSNPGNQINSETSDKLIDYLIEHKHWSPLEMASACIEITTTRDIARQILRHRSFSFQEFSQRYAAVDTDSFVLREARLQDHKNRQNSIELPDNLILDSKTLMNSGWLKEEWRKQQLKVIVAAKEAYEWALANNIAKEQARAVLPEGLTPSTMYMNGTLRSWVHYIELRSDNGTQKEHREVALACAEAIAKIWPMELQ
jgi:thymidylate synthase (FAD)